jgi:hypothetical protein
MVLAWTTQGVIEWRSSLWLVPLAFGIAALRLSLRPGVEPGTVALFSAFSVLAVVCVIALAVLVTCFSFGYPVITSR